MAVRDELTYEPLLERDGVRVSRSPWGPDDEIGRLNWITPEASLELLGRTGGARIFDLSVDYFMGMPSFQAFGDPPYQISMTHTPHGTIADDASGMGADVHRKYSYCGVVLDVAALHGVDRVPDDTVIGPDDLRGAASRQALELRRGDIVLIRTGKM